MLRGIHITQPFFTIKGMDPVLESVATAIYGNRELDIHDVIRYLCDYNVTDNSITFEVDSQGDFYGSSHVSVIIHSCCIHA